MRNSYLVLIVILFLTTQTQSQNVGIGTTTPMATLSVGSSSQFRVNSSGNIIMVNNVPYSFPTVQGTNQYLMNDGSGNLNWAPAPRPVVRVFSLLGDGSNWLIDNPSDYGSGSNEDPDLTLYKGFTYHFKNDSGGHTFFITDEPGTGSYNVGVTNNGAGSGTIMFTVPMDAPNNLYYYCGIHPTTMAGTIKIL
jgi:hypothetical protein